MPVATVRAAYPGQHRHGGRVSAGHLNDQSSLHLVVGLHGFGFMLKAAFTAISDMPPFGNLAAV